MENNVTLKKIPVWALLEILTAAWDRGANYVDIVGIPNEHQDTLRVVINPEYYEQEGPKLMEITGKEIDENQLPPDDEDDKLDDETKFTDLI